MKPAYHYAVIRDARLRAVMKRRLKSEDFGHSRAGTGNGHMIIVGMVLITMLIFSYTVVGAMQ
jgi:hypothetical protein